ncbi:MAG: hypothetical protein ACU0DI_12400 [Paracoccaceae bacterium]
MNAQSPVVVLDIPRMSLIAGDHLILAAELLGRFLEGSLIANFAAAIFAAKMQIPILGEVLG